MDAVDQLAAAVGVAEACRVRGRRAVAIIVLDSCPTPRHRHRPNAQFQLDP
jgi:hypothetical protein